MEAKPNRSYEDFDPVCKWRGDEARDTLEVHLPGFRREQVKVQVKHLDFILISGGRPLDGTRWKRFNKEVELPKFCNVDAIHANFQQSILSVVMPKKITQKEEIEYEHDEEIEEKEEEEETGHRYLEFRGWSIRELEGKPRRHDHHHHHDAADHINAA
ncbi:hypothetical protein L6164_004798 [Bauhinia variegata]|uniref:Uncharacterized protein n=1 Tax=Bauhinia variegata TaxID=167791 RepID=A0ACB9PP73_BAUVA|nr:hypothetical protein L6164_004798 [Bauhinia variegata]